MPVGIMYVSAYLKQQKHDVICLNQNHYPAGRLKELLQEMPFDVVATGGLFVDIVICQNVIRTVREYDPNIKVILGGAIASADPEFIMGELKPDFLVIGEGERTADLLLKALENRTSLRQVNGIGFIEEGKLVKTPPTSLIKDLDTLPLPDYEGFEYNDYLDRVSSRNPQLCSIRGNDHMVRMAPVFSSRDCVAKCTFCYRLMGGKYRLRSIRNVIREIHYLVDRYKVNEISVLDEMFVTGKDRIQEFCEAIKPLGIPWQCQSRVTAVNDEILIMMKESGCYFISYGFESGSPTVLKSMRKGVSPESMERAIRSTQKARMAIQGNFIFGDPAETMATARETIQFSRKFERLFLGYGFIFPYPGTELYSRLVLQGKMPDRRLFYECPGHKFYNMTNLSDIDFQVLVMKVRVEQFRRNLLSSGKILSLKKKEKGWYLIDFRCHHCGGDNPGCLMESSGKNIIICKYCYQRNGFDRADIRFGDARAFIKKILFFYVMSIPGSLFFFKARCYLRNMKAWLKKGCV
ncbi:MAG: radical SAM protein [Candidatus Omnitrophota bacterium]|nr:radical SAM protein [Candidatus Omnitrophota bacterium]